MDPTTRARRVRDRGLRKVNTGTRWLAAGAAAGVGVFSGALALPHLVAGAQAQVDTTSGSSTDDPTATGTPDATVPSAPSPSGSSSHATPSTSARSTPPTTSSLTPPAQAPSPPRRRSRAVTGAS